MSSQDQNSEQIFISLLRVYISRLNQNIFKVQVINAALFYFNAIEIPAASKVARKRGVLNNWFFLLFNEF
jgi:hypothetical protein